MTDNRRNLNDWVAANGWWFGPVALLLVIVAIVVLI